MPSPAIVTDDAAHAAYDIAIETWGERGWRAVGRICRWAERSGMVIACPAAEGDR